MAKRNELRTITVRELIEALEGQDPDMPVVFTCDYGDYHHTPQALAICDEMEELPLVESAYSHSGFALQEDDRDDEEECSLCEMPNGKHEEDCPNREDEEDEQLYLVLSSRLRR